METQSGRRYRVTKTTQPLRWSALIKGVKPTVTSERSIAIHLDTPDLRLARAGLILRHRLTENECRWDLTIPMVGGGSHTVSSVDERGVLPDLDEPPARLTGLLTASVRDAKLEPVAAIRTDRQILVWTNSAGNDLLRLTEDRIKARKLPDGRGRRWREIEVDPDSSGGAPLLHRLHALLTTTGMHRTDRSALARVLGKKLNEHARGTRSSRPTAADTLAVCLRVHVAAIQCADVAVRADLPDSRCQLRDSAQRLRDVLRTYRHIIDGTATKPLAEELRWLAATDEVEPLNGDRYAGLTSALQSLVDEEPWTSTAARPADRVLGKALLKANRGVKRHLLAAARADRTERDLELRKARRAAARLHSAAEAAEPALGCAARAAARETARLDHALSAHTPVTAAELRRFARRFQRVSSRLTR